MYKRHSTALKIGNKFAKYMCTFGGLLHYAVDQLECSVSQLDKFKLSGRTFNLLIDLWESTHIGNHVLARNQPDVFSGIVTNIEYRSTELSEGLLSRFKFRAKNRALLDNAR